jgi:hypothetical protein
MVLNSERVLKQDHIFYSSGGDSEIMCREEKWQCISISGNQNHVKIWVSWTIEIDILHYFSLYPSFRCDAFLSYLIIEEVYLYTNIKLFHLFTHTI